MKATVKVTDPEKYAATVDSVNLEGCTATAMKLQKQWQIHRYWIIGGTVVVIQKDGFNRAVTGEMTGDDFRQDYGFEIIGEPENA